MPELAADITPDELEKEIRDELRSLPNDLADLIACHLVAAERALGDDDAPLAYEHAKVARRFAARIGVVREAVGIAAYRAGQYAEALSDLRAARRLTGSDEYLPILADCERGLGRPERALDLVRSPESERLDRVGRVELAIVESGARRDLGQKDAAVITLQRLPELRGLEPRPWSARLAFAYADALADAGHESAAADWFERAMTFDEDGETDAAERYAELTGIAIDDVEDDAEGLDILDDEEAPVAGVRLDPAPAEVDDAVHDLGERPAETGAVDAGQAVEEASAEGEIDTAGRDDVVETDLHEVEDDEDDEDDLGTAGSDVLDDDEDAPEPVVAEPAVAEAEPEGGESGEWSDAPAEGAEESPAATSGAKATRPEPGMAPAFIEPDFGVSAGGVAGDVLDDDFEDVKPDRRDM
ncbi:hypothetical protein [Sphaerisporangium sp. TRM90804]|uniref:hypothetical protein n=1 Tax=Sphaerisporangium sp. TRM90804 TaxID=3031113 RepID=UPI002446A3DC|nr:hypothetical protein [Sphaerisporangium sp. TRM90804]MDH2430308.1 hypothetical protein [Sphaerisporangium sp. TRM90804]